MTDNVINEAPQDLDTSGLDNEEAQAATKAQVFAAAERLFALHGFQNVSVRDITAEAGVNLASVNYHFGSKDALLFEIFRRRTGELNRERARMLPSWKPISRRPCAGPIPPATGASQCSSSSGRARRARPRSARCCRATSAIWPASLTP